MLRVVEMTKTINGECNAWGQGTPCFLIRFAGCNLKCDYCDAQVAQNPDASNATELQAVELVDIILESTPKDGIVLITGGEPLLQDHGELNVVLTNPELIDRYFVVETNGTISSEFNFLQHNISWVIDSKLPSSGIMHDWEVPWEYAPKTMNFCVLRKGQDFIKFVIDMDAPDSYSADVIPAGLMMSYLHFHGCEVQFIISPIMSKKSRFDQYTAQLTVNWLHDLRKRGINAALNLQIHKLLGIA